MNDKDTIRTEVERLQELSRTFWNEHCDNTYMGAVEVLGKLLEFIDEMSPEPKFKVGDCMRTKEEAAAGIVSGLPYVVDIKDGFYLCNNEKIDIRNQEEYEFPPMNSTSIDDVKQEVQKKIDHINKFLPENVGDKVVFSTWDANMLGQRTALMEVLEFIKNKEDEIKG